MWCCYMIPLENFSMLKLPPPKIKNSNNKNEVSDRVKLQHDFQNWIILNKLWKIILNHSFKFEIIMLTKGRNKSVLTEPRQEMKELIKSDKKMNIQAEQGK